MALLLATYHTSKSNYRIKKNTYLPNYIELQYSIGMQELSINSDRIINLPCGTSLPKTLLVTSKSAITPLVTRFMNVMSLMTFVCNLLSYACPCRGKFTCYCQYCEHKLLVCDCVGVDPAHRIVAMSYLTIRSSQVTECKRV